jgi:uncharacterized protein
MLPRFLTLLVLITLPSPITNAWQAAPPTSGTQTVPAKLSASEIAEVQKKADAGDASAQFALGKAYESGNGLRQDPKQAALWYRKAAEQGNAKAQNSLGVLYWLGDGVERDKKQAVQWYRKAARQGEASAMFNLGAAYYNGDGVPESNVQSYAWFLLSSEAGSPSGQDAAKRSQGEHGPEMFTEACLTIGQMYLMGEDLPRDLRLAAGWYRKAAERGHTQAHAAKDYDDAGHWCELAAKEKHSPGYFCLGYLYQHGLGVPQNSKKAFRWYQQGAREFHPESVQALAQMYATGEGRKQDRPEALVWLLESGRRGDKDALVAAQKLRSSMAEKEWKDAQKKLRQRGLDLQ